MEPEDVAEPVKLISSSDTVVSIDVCRKTFTLQQRPASGAHGKVVWEGAVSLAKYMECNPKQFCHSKLCGKRVLELGSDLVDVVPLLESNVAANAPASSILPTLPRGEPAPYPDAAAAAASPSTAASAGSSEDAAQWGRVGCRVLEWGTDDPDLYGGPYDIIVGSDVVYSESLVPVLLNTIHALASPRSLILLANEFRCTVVSEVFLTTARTLFDVKKIPSKRQHPDRVSQYMHLFELRKKL